MTSFGETSHGKYAVWWKFSAGKVRVYKSKTVIKMAYDLLASLGQYFLESSSICETI